MATVPVQDIPTVDLQPSNVIPLQAPGVEPMRNAAPEQMQQFGKATMQAAVAMQTIADRINDEIDDAATKEADNLFSDSGRTILHDPESGYLSTVGKKALDSRKATVDSLNEARKKVEQTLTTDMQRKMFNQVANRRMQAALLSVETHAMQQAKAYNVGEIKARATASIQDAVANYSTRNMRDDDGKATGPFNLYKATAVSEMNALADTMQLPADSAQRKELVLAATTQITSEVVARMVANDQTAQARDFLASAIKAKEVNPTRIDELQNLVKTSGVKDESLRLSMTIKGGLNSQLSTVDKMFNDGKISAEVRDATTQRIEHNYTRRKNLENEGNKAAMGSFQDWIINNPGKPIIDAPAALYAWAKAQGHLSGLDGFAQREGRAGDRMKELETRGILLSLAVNDPNQFLKEFTESGFVNRLDLGASGIKEMQTMAMQIQQNNGRFKAVFDQKILQDAIPKSLLSSGAKDKRDAFVALMAEETQAWIKENPGKQPDQAAYARVAQVANREWISMGAIWGTNIEPAYKARAAGEGLPKEVYDIMAQSRKPFQEIQTFYKEMRKRGASDRDIINAWNIKTGRVG